MTAATHEWVDDQATFEAVLDELSRVDRYAIDTEFHRERTYFPALALVQIAWADRIVLIDPLAVDEFDALVHRLGDAGVAVLMVTHDLYGATRIASRLGLLRDGRLTEVFERGEAGIDAEAVRRAYAAGASGEGDDRGQAA